MLTVLVSIASLCWVKGAALLACAPFGSGCLLLGMLVLSGVDVLAALVAAALALSRRVRPTWGSAVAALLMAVALIALWNVDAHGSGAVVACGAVLALTIVAPLQFCILLLGRGGRAPGRRRAPLAAAVLCGSAASVALLTMGAADAHRLLPDLLDALWSEMGFGTLVIDQMPVSVSLADVVRLSTGTDTTAPAAAPVGLALLVAIPLAVCLLRVGPWRARPRALHGMPGVDMHLVCRLRSDARTARCSRCRFDGRQPYRVRLLRHTSDGRATSWRSDEDRGHGCFGRVAGGRYLRGRSAHRRAGGVLEGTRPQRARMRDVEAPDGR